MLFNTFTKVVVILVLLAHVRGNFQGHGTAALLRDVADFVDRNDLDPDYDDVTQDDDLMSEVKQIMADHGFNSDEVLGDVTGFLSTIPAIFKSGDSERWASLNFGRQLACYQGKSGDFVDESIWAATRFNGYGCYCGAGDYNGNYLDATDKCCLHHDHCYIAVMKKYNLKEGCMTYTTPYSVSCCASSHVTKCTDSGPSAGRELCQCDQDMASCTARNKATYNAALLNDRSKCHDVGSTKVLGIWDILASCKELVNTAVKLPQTYDSQGTCPNGGTKESGWFWGRR